MTTRLQRSMQLCKTVLLPLLVCAALASCASLVGTRQVTVPLARLQASLDKRFPVEHRLLSVFEVRLTRPQLTLLADSDRVALSMQASVESPFLKRALHGSMALSGHLSVDNVRNAVVITEARIDHFEFDGLDAGRQQQLAGVANLLSDEVLKDASLYTFRPDELRYAGVQFVPSRITTTPAALIVSFEPAK